MNQKMRTEVNQEEKTEVSQEKQSVSGKEGRRGLSRILQEFWNQDTDTIIYTLMCILTIPAVLFGAWYLLSVQNHMQNMPPCALVLLLGAYCPGCGGTRAFMALFRGDILKAIYYHPGAVYGVGLYITYFVSQTVMRISKGKIRGMKLRPLYLYIMLALILLNFIIRNVLLFVFHIDTLSG